MAQAVILAMLAVLVGGCAARPPCQERILWPDVPFYRCVLDSCPTTSPKALRCA